MQLTGSKPNSLNLTALFAGICITLICLALAPTSAHAVSFAQTGCFGNNEAGKEPPATPQAACNPIAENKFGEEVQLGGVGGVAVNYTGAGGVPAGTVYAAGKGLGPNLIAMYEPTSSGGLRFVMRWKVTVTDEEYERCGPVGELPNGEVQHPQCEPHETGVSDSVDVAVDQVTGNVYAQLQYGSGPVGGTLIVEYVADGGEVVTRFGRVAESGKSTAETPGEIHGVYNQGSIAVNDLGEVFVSDVNFGDNRYHRVMRFRPKTPGKVDEYEYAGTGEDIAPGFLSEGLFPGGLMTDSTGHIYVLSEERTISEYDPAHPADPPICTFSFSQGRIKSMTVDPLSGSPFFFTSASPKGIRQLSPCNEGTGEFVEVGQIEVKPERADVWALTFDPSRELLPGGAPGVLYGAAPGPVPESGTGTGQPGQGALGYIFGPVPESPAVVRSESVSKVTASSAALNAVVNPEGFDTRYAFQYMTAASFELGGETFAGAAEAPVGGGSVGGSKADVAVSMAALALEPNTEYRYRVVLTSHCSPGEPEKVCEVAGATRTFRTYPGGTAALSDHRAYELVSPVEKKNGEVFPLNPRIASCSFECKPGLGQGRFPMQSSLNGEAVAYEGSAFDAVAGSQAENEYLARRTGSGWQTTNPTPPALVSRSGQGYKAFDEEMSEAVLGQPEPGGISPEAPSGYADLYAQPVGNPFALRPLMASEPPNRPPGGTNRLEIEYAGAADDLSRVFFEANDALTEATPFAPAASDGGAGKFNLYEWERATGELRLVNIDPGNTATAPGASYPAGSANAISSDGNRAFWSDPSGQVFVRENAEVTREIPDPGKFLAAATDGSKVLLGDGHLYDLETDDITDLTGGKGGFQGIAGQSDDLSRVYFVDTAVLSGEEENSEGDKAQAGGLNLYTWAGEPSPRFVATLLLSDNGEGSELTGIRGDWVGVPTGRSAKASPSGRYLAFLSLASLTGFDNTGVAAGHCKVAVNGPPPVFGSGPCAEAFLYDSVDQTLICASCNPSGAAPLGWTQLPLIEGPGSLPQPEFLNDSGRLFFDSGDSLSQFDSNGGAQDVYQWEPDGVGTCEREEGCLNLISSGTGSSDANLMAADPSGKNVFFTTRNRLVDTDQDELIDLYDAREFGGFPSSPPPPGECQGEGCQPSPPGPSQLSPASSGFNGPGNVKRDKSCKKGQVKRKGRCVKRHKSKKKAKHSGKHGGAK